MSSLENKIKSAERTLNGAFGIKKNQEGEENYKFLDQETLASAYKEEASRKEVTERFLSIAKSIRKIRSSYLPSSFVRDGERLSIDVEDNYANLESYENAFMRMLGMPSITEPRFGVTNDDHLINSTSQFLTVSSSGKIENKDNNYVRDFILDQRRRERCSRRIIINDSIYNISEATSSFLNEDVISIINLSTEEKAQLFGVEISEGKLLDGNGDVVAIEPMEIFISDDEAGYLNPLKNGEIIPTSSVRQFSVQASEEELRANIQNLDRDFWKFSYLLLPPVQDAAIVKCINEPDKIVASPFSSSKFGNVNQSRVRTPLLESIIRIRLDRASGTDSFFAREEENEENFSITVDEEKYDVKSDDYGILEALFILRLKSAISGLAKKMVVDRDIIINEMLKSKRYPKEGDSVNCGTPNQKFGSKRNYEKTKQPGVNTSTEDSLVQQKLIEDSLMFLLGDASEALDLQLQTQRNSTIYDSHMMSGLIDIIDIPRTRINEQIEKINKDRNRQVSNTVEQKIQEIDLILGTNIGIGTLDLAVFSLALFSIPEDKLLGLLTEAQFERIKNGEFSSLILPNQSKSNIVDSINTLTQYIIDGYNLFKQELETDSR